ncbi:MAG: hypothetical protein COV74_00865 [Candidatus Omnitrophica bacterium CG11_big_fil_rev_8_21_14_0_20_45_26]|uniref:Chorismate dehydratase n=1 Tax=Candidatus Abzuiibacterium crystallinum TaxID=1974748 RepID=A0A2H0LSR6_9BACT|nr:MAG: hypothetical protein COV74_00865 [Candidatus Omnitrophica bacterium CG11_big_fil_rev_8_21_14_0_20_45_26]PIW65327.1 MAG: hypothetical protein COW12_02450 [Candidatus Omnitrophica bacterium CG12_big_fil_rev_8_21_14_0_65_45_16]
MPTTVETKKLKIGRISYLNTLPFYFELFQTGDVCVTQNGYPAQINQWMQEGAIDIAPISSLEYGRHPDAYYLLPGVSIGARRHSGSVLLFSREPIERLKSQPIAVSEESYSSQILLKILLAKRFHSDHQFIPLSGTIDSMLEAAPACLAIGDKALFYRSSNFCYKYDLSEWWYEWTGLPFCFAVWAVRREACQENAAAVRSFSDQLKVSLERNLNQLPVLIEKELNLSIADEKYALVYSYLSQLSNHLNEEMQTGLKRFFELACEINAIEKVPPLEFIQEFAA